MKICIIIPAHNEQNRIERTLKAYATYFNQQISLNYTLLVILNACTDQTKNVVKRVQQDFPTIEYDDLPLGGKGYAITQGFKKALQDSYDAIGFVDADMATSPAEYHKLIIALFDDNSDDVSAAHPEPVEGAASCDGVIASRYMQGSKVFPPRPWIKRWGSKLVFEPLIWLLFGMYYYDYQCGAKLFKTNVISTVTPALTITHWAFDVELLYVCKKHQYVIKEIPTEWHDQAGSKLSIGSGFKMLGNLFWIWWKH